MSASPFCPCASVAVVVPEESVTVMSAPVSVCSTFGRRAHAVLAVGTVLPVGAPRRPGRRRSRRAPPPRAGRPFASVAAAAAAVAAGDRGRCPLGGRKPPAVPSSTAASISSSASSNLPDRLQKHRVPVAARALDAAERSRHAHGERRGRDRLVTAADNHLRVDRALRARHRCGPEHAEPAVLGVHRLERLASARPRLAVGATAGMPSRR